MNTKSLTLTLTLAVALLTLGYENSASAKPPNCDDDPTHQKCKNDEPTNGSISYEAELRGAFAFDKLPFDSEGSYLQRNHDVTITRPPSGTEAYATYDHVFSMPAADSELPCNLFGPPSPFGPDSFTAPKNERNVKGWEIDKPGSVRVLFRGVPITFGGKDVVVRSGPQKSDSAIRWNPA